MHRFTMIPDWVFKTCFRREIHLILCLVLVGCSSMPKLDADELNVRLKGKMVVSNDHVKKILRYRFEGNVENGSSLILAQHGGYYFQEKKHFFLYFYV